MRNIRINEEIRAQQVRTIDQDGKQLGVLPTDEAMALAEKAGVDLVEVAAQGDPPVCRIMDYGKYRYEQTKRVKEAKKKQHVIKVKEIKFHPNIDVHDYSIKLKHATDFLEKGHKVKFSIVYRGREMAHQEIGRELLNRLIADISEYGAVETLPKMMGRNLFATVGPTKPTGGSE